MLLRIGGPQEHGLLNSAYGKRDIVGRQFNILANMRLLSPIQAVAELCVDSHYLLIEVQCLL